MNLHLYLFAVCLRYQFLHLILKIFWVIVEYGVKHLNLSFSHLSYHFFLNYSLIQTTFPLLIFEVSLPHIKFKIYVSFCFWAIHFVPFIFLFWCPYFIVFIIVTLLYVYYCPHHCSFSKLCRKHSLVYSSMGTLKLFPHFSTQKSHWNFDWNCVKLSH